MSKGFGDVPPEVTAKVVAWICEDDAHPLAFKLNGKDVYAPKVCEDLNLMDSYKEAKPLPEESRL